MEFEEIYRLYSPKIFRVCMAYVNDREHARDLSQETFISVWENLPRFRGEAGISTWIFRIATNTCLRAIEKGKRIRLTELEDGLSVRQDEPAEDQLGKLYDCIAELGETERIIISLVLEDLGGEEIAAILGLSHANTRVKIHRIKLKLAEKMKRYG